MKSRGATRCVAAAFAARPYINPHTIAAISDTLTITTPAVRRLFSSVRSTPVAE